MTVRARLDALHSPDLLDLKRGAPGDPEDFGILVQAMIGPAASETPSGESFDFLVCTPRWLERNVAPGEYRFGRSLLILARYDYRVLHRAITKLCHRTEGDDWPAVAERLNRFAHWEFEDYRPHATGR